MPSTTDAAVRRALGDDRPYQGPPAPPLDWPVALELVCAHTICVTDILHVHRGGGWKDLYVRRTIPGWGGGESWANSDSREVTIRREHRGVPVYVKWSDVADVITAGVCDELAAEASIAYAWYCALAGGDHAIDFGYAADVDERIANYYDASGGVHQRMRAVEDQVRRIGLAAVLSIAADAKPLTLF